MGQHNLGHDIPELLAVTTTTGDDSAPTQIPLPTVKTSPQAAANLTSSIIGFIPSAEDSKMAPAEASITRMGKRTAIGIDIMLVFLVVGVWLGLIELGIFPHVKRGFYCDDRSIAHPFNGDTISMVLILSSVFVPFFLVWLAEAIFYVPSSVKSTRIRKSCVQSFLWFREYMIGIILHLFVMDALKVFVGELRPHFLYTCRPDAAVNCSGGEFITDYTCTNTWEKQFFVRDASKSFPSGHSSIAFFEAVFMIWYIQQRVPNLRSKMLIPTIQVLFLVWASLCGVSRITDHRHHWWDVLAGAILGISFAVFTCIYLCKNFKCVPPLSPDIVTQNGNGNSRHKSVRRLLSDASCNDDVTMNQVVVS